MATGIFKATDVYTGVEEILPPFSLQSVTTPVTAEVKRLVNNREVVVGEATWDTQRLTTNVQWTIRFMHLEDGLAPAMTTGRLKSLLLHWASSGAVLTLSGVDFLDIVREPLVDVGNTPGQIWRSAHPWWGDGEVIKVDGATVSSSEYTVNAEVGLVTFDTPLSPGQVVTCTVSREPQVRVMSVPPNPQNLYGPVVYGPEVTFHEETPAY